MHLSKCHSSWSRRCLKGQVMFSVYKNLQVRIVRESLSRDRKTEKEKQEKKSESRGQDILCFSYLSLGRSFSYNNHCLISQRNYNVLFYCGLKYNYDPTLTSTSLTKERGENPHFKMFL